MAHRLLRTLVFSSSILLEGPVAGCASTHDRVEPDAPLPRDGGPSTDAGHPLSDAPLRPDVPVRPDAGPLDAGPPDAGPPDVGPPDVGPSDGGFVLDGAVIDFCELGWPSTKGQVCEVRDDIVVCCGGVVEPGCCIGRVEE